MPAKDVNNFTLGERYLISPWVKGVNIYPG
jgi:hypothetical protein